MKKIGLTGGIASGKSTVANLFAKLGVPIIDADAIAHEITQPELPATQQIINHFGHDVVKHKNHLDRKKLANIVFNDPEKRKWLETLLHPLIREEMKRQAEAISTPYCILMIPLLTETGHIDYLDRILVVDIPEALQLKRAIARDKAHAHEVEAILAAQASRKSRLQIADDVIINDKDLDSLSQQVKILHEKYSQ